MSLSTWIQLAQILLKGNASAEMGLSVLKLLTASVETTASDLSDLLEAPITAGKGYLVRAEREPSAARSFIEKAQDEFTKLISYEKRPILASRACYFVGVCHDLLETPERGGPYFADAFKKAMEAIELCQYRSTGLFWGAFSMKKHGIQILDATCSKCNRPLLYPVKDDYIKGLEEIVGMTMPICFDPSRSCDHFRGDGSYYSGWSGGMLWFTRKFPNEESDYWRARTRTYAQLSGFYDPIG